MPFGKYRDFDDCMMKNKGKKNPQAYCAEIMRKVEGEMMGKKQSKRRMKKGKY